MSAKFFSIEDFYGEEMNVRVTEQGAKNLMTLSEIVMNSHYSYATDKEDLKSVGVKKALDLLYNGGFDPSRSSLKNYLYTGMRNEMKNYLYKNSRDVPVDDEILLGINQSYEDPTDGTYGLLVVDDSEIRRALGRLFNEERFNKVRASLNSIGFTTTSKEFVRYREVDKEVALVLWKKLK